MAPADAQRRAQRVGGGEELFGDLVADHRQRTPAVDLERRQVTSAIDLEGREVGVLGADAANRHVLDLVRAGPDVLPFRRLGGHVQQGAPLPRQRIGVVVGQLRTPQDRKSTRLNSSHGYISYAVFCLKKKKKK